MVGPRSAQFVVALYGPTSSGKTKLSVNLAHLLAHRFGRETVVIAADSRQVYRYMDIGTSKTTPQQMRGIRHELIDIAEPARKLELEEYSALARTQIASCLAAGTIPLIVGGTGIYVKALLEGWDVEAAGSVRGSLRRDFPRAMIGDAHSMLRRLDRDLAGRIHTNNYEAIINALATVMATGQRTTRQSAGGTQILLGLDPGPHRLDAAVAATYDEQVRRGLATEIADLAARYDLDREYRRRGADSPNQVLHTHGYREYFEIASDRGKAVDMLNDRDLADVRTAVTDHIRQYTRRQRSWFRKLPAARMVSDAEQALRVIADPRSGGR